jgi:hypothetical protein
LLLRRASAVPGGCAAHNVSKERMRRNGNEGGKCGHTLVSVGMSVLSVKLSATDRSPSIFYSLMMQRVVCLKAALFGDNVRESVDDGHRDLFETRVSFGWRSERIG